MQLCQNAASASLPKRWSGRGSFPGNLFVVLLTSQLPNVDFALAVWREAGLNVPSGVKGQLCTVEDRLVRKIVGQLTDADVATLDSHLRRRLRI